VSLINQMLHCYTNPDVLFYIGTTKLSVAKLAMIVDAVFQGLGKKMATQSAPGSHMKIVS
jgi:hypothetical protein